jgi:hypothetical protein
VELRAIIRSVVIRFAQTEAPADPFYITGIVEAIRQRYEFFEVPTKVGDLDPKAGVQFLVGRFEGSVIAKMVIYENGISAEGPVNTDVLDKFLDDIFAWTTAEFGVSHQDNSSVRRTYLSGIEVVPDMTLEKWAIPLDELRTTLTSMLTDQGFEIPPYEFNGFSLHMDGAETESMPLRPVRFVFEHRAGHPYGDNVYFSECPTTTDQHLRLLGVLERSV